MAFEDLEYEDSYEDTLIEGEEGGEGAPPEESSNRTFLIIAGILGAVALLTLICIIGYIFLGPLAANNEQAQTQAAIVYAQQTEVAQVIARTATAAAISAAATQTASVPPTPTNTPIPPTKTATPTNTPVLAVSDTPAATLEPLTATVAALLTEAASTQTALPANTTLTPTPTGLPDTGFAEDVGLPTMLGAAALLLVVIFLARRLRTA